MACAVLGGCAGLPRIDPSGERVFVWAKDQPAAPALVGTSPTLVAPAVITDPFFPQAPVVAAAAPAPGVVVAPVVTPASVAFAQMPQDKVSITPERVLAPVGSEVVLKASICTTEGYTLADQKVEWMLGRNGVGQFVEVSGKGLFHPPLFPWNKPKKIDNYLATGWTANAPLCVNRGTADPSDDVNINRGDAWISVTSPNEGTSYVTAYTPTVESWEQRKSAATIYWVDVQWTFPPPSVGGGGRRALLTTVVTRQTNGAPIEGWLVRYELADGGGNLAGGTTGQVVEVRTDSEGRASVEATPTASGAASTPVNIQLIRPAGVGGDDSPRLVVGTGASVIQWTSGSTDYLPPASGMPAPSLSTTPTPAPTTAPPGGVWTTPGTTGGAPTMPSTPAARPQLQVTLTGDQQAVVGGQAQLILEIRNLGTAPATNVRVFDRWDGGLMYVPDPSTGRTPDPNLLEVELASPPGGTIAPGSPPLRKPVPFNVMRAGRFCHNVTVTCAENANDSGTHCVTATQPVEQRAGSVSVVKEAERSVIVGQVAHFRVTVKNTGPIALVNIRVTDIYPTNYFRVTPPPGVTVTNGVVVRMIERLEPGQSASLPVEATALQPSRPVLPFPRVDVRAQTDPPTAEVPTSNEWEMEILGPQGGGPAVPPAGGAGTLGAAPPSGTGPIRVNVTFDTQPARINSRANCMVTLTNTAATVDSNVEMVLVLPLQVVPDVAGIQAPPSVSARREGDRLIFTPVAALRAGEPIRFIIPLNVMGPAGLAEIRTFVRSQNMPQSVRPDSLDIVSQ